MGAKYSGEAIVGYNATPPPDDGSFNASNETIWQKHKTKLADPNLVLAEAINDSLLVHTDETVLNIGSSQTTNATMHKRTLNVTGAFTVSLGTAASFPAGYYVWIKNSHSAAITVNLAQPLNTLDGVVAGSTMIPPGKAFWFIRNSSADGFLRQINNKAGVGVGDAVFITALIDQEWVQASPVALSANPDDELFFPMEANSSYLFRGLIIYEDAATNINYGVLALDGDAAGMNLQTRGVNPDPLFNIGNNGWRDGTSKNVDIRFDDGTFQCRWQINGVVRSNIAQNFQTAFTQGVSMLGNPSVRKAGSVLYYQKIG